MKFATFSDVHDIQHKTYKIILKKGGCVVPDDTTLLSLHAGAYHCCFRFFCLIFCDTQ